ncbi:MAG: M16 family metallopeptidase [Myxococcaceae bacterium]
MKTLKAVLAVWALTGCATTQKEVAATDKPTGAGAALPVSNPAEAWRTSPPAPGQSPVLAVPKFSKSVLPNGLTVIVSEQHSLPLVGLAFASGAGSAVDPSGKAGLAQLTYGLMAKGAGPYDAIALDEAFANLGAEAFTETTPDGAIIGTRVLSTEVDPALKLLKLLIRQPRFDKGEFDQQKKEHLDSLALALGNPRYLAREASGATFYGSGHPYAQLGMGTPDSVTNISVDDVTRFYKQQVGPKNAVFVASGDVTLEQAVAWAKAAFGDWKTTAVRPPVPPSVPPKARELVLVPKAGLVQTLIVVGRPSVSALSSDAVPLELASSVFGGFFGSRLNMNLREGRGFSYGATAYVDARRGQGPVTASSSVRADVTGPSLQEFFNELNGIKTRPITAKELESAREGLIRSLPGSFETIEDLLHAAAGLYWEEKPLDYFDRLAADLQAATPAQVQAAAEKYFDPKTLDVVLVGDPQVVQTQVAPLNLGTITVHQPPGAVKASSSGAATPAGQK